MRNTVVEANQRLLNILRWVIIGLAALSFCVQLASLWASLDHLDTEWMVLRTFPVVHSFFSLDQYILYYLALRLFALAINWLAVLVLLAKKTTQAGGLLAALTLIALPNLILLGEMRPASTLLNPWLAQAANLRLLFAFLGLGLLVWLYLSFPGWRPSRRVLVWFGCLMAGALAVLAIVSASGQLVDAFGATLGLIMICLVIGIGVQVFRLSKLSTTYERHQTVWIVTAFILLPVLAGIFSSGVFNQDWGFLISASWSARSRRWPASPRCTRWRWRAT